MAYIVMAYIVMAHKNMAYIVVPQAADEPEAAARMRAKAALLQVTERACVRACLRRRMPVKARKPREP